MQQLQAYKFELRQNGEQARKMRQFAGACRFVYNKALALQKARREVGEKHLGYASLCKHLTEWRRSVETPWLKEAHSQIVQQALKDLERAYTNFFEKRAAFPRFKKQGQSDRFRFPQGITLGNSNGRIKLPKLGWMRYRKSRDVLGEVRNVTVSLSHGKWFVSIQTERTVEQAVAQGAAVGIDVGVARFATLSDGRPIEAINSFRKHEARLRRYQRRTSRKVKFSNNWKKAQAKVKKLHYGIANIRKDFLHKASTAICKNHALVVVEDLKVRNMSASAAGTIGAPGVNVRAKSGLNKSILDQGWSEFRRQLEYKMAWKGGSLIAVPPQYTSQICPRCGHTSKDNRKTQAKFECIGCGFKENADLVGAINILERGYRL
ncbi:MAG: RNA-guided endonuclease TnpB family protein, partial [Actinomycetes bacterium]